MTYTPTTWDTGDTITAAKMNNIEAGIQDAANVAIVRMSAIGYGSGTTMYGSIVYATYDQTYSTWVVSQDDGTYWEGIHGYQNGAPSIIPLYLTVLPSSDDVGLFFVEANNAGVTVTGDIAATNLYHSWGSLIPRAYRITGDGTISLDNS